VAEEERRRGAAGVAEAADAEVVGDGERRGGDERGRRGRDGHGGAEG